MTLNYMETLTLIQLVLSNPSPIARRELHRELQRLCYTEPEFCSGVIKHGPGMSFTSIQWCDFFSKVPNKLFFREPSLMDKLSPSQGHQLGLDSLASRK